MRVTHSILPLAVAALSAYNRTIANPEEYASILVGTDSRSEWSNGNSLPLVGVPWGHTYWAPETETDDGGAWWFNPNSGFLVGLRCTHQPSPWIGDWGWFRMTFGYQDEGWSSMQGWDVSKAQTYPFHFGTELLGVSSVGDEAGNGQGNARVDVTAAEQASHIRVEWPRAAPAGFSGINQGRRIRIERRSQNHEISRDDWTVTMEKEGNTTLTVIKSFTTSWNSWGTDDGMMEAAKPTFRLHFVMKLDTIYGEMVYSPGTTSDTMEIRFDETVEVVEIRTGTSLISSGIANEAVIQQTAGNFTESMTANKERWADTLGVIDVKETGYEGALEEEKLQIYYSNLYRAALFPRNLEELDGRHWSPYTGLIHDGPLSADSGFWDAYHTVYSVMALLWPEQVPVVMTGYLNAFDEGGWVPQWSSPGYKGSMVGSMSDVSIADMMLKGFKFDYLKALAAMKKDAFTPSTGASRGRRGIIDFETLGFVPHGGTDSLGDVHEVVSRTLNHAYADWAIVQAAKEVPLQTVITPSEIRRLEERSNHWKNIFNPENKFFMSKDGKGQWTYPFDQYLWGGDYTEGGPWQFRFYAPHDVKAISAAYGGVAELCDMVNEMNIHPSYFHRAAANYGSPIHEMLEMQLNVWGQNSHNNQPSHHANYMPIAAAYDDPSHHDKCQAKAQKWIKKSMTDTYKLWKYSGDEDNGEMAGWLILSSLGFYPMTPGSNDFILGVPFFRHVELSLRDNRVLSVIAPENCNDCHHVHEVAMDRVWLDNWRVTWEQLQEGGELHFYMGSDRLWDDDGSKEPKETKTTKPAGNLRRNIVEFD